MATTEVEVCVTKCQAALTSADKLIKLQGEQIANQGALIKHYDALNEALLKQLADLKGREGAWYKKPQYTVPLSLVLGFFVGAYVMHSGRGL